VRVKRIIVGLLLTSSAACGQQMGTSWHILPNPRTDLYPRYVADPRRSRNIITILQAFNSGVPLTGNKRWGLSIGGQYSLLRLYRGENPENGWQFDVEARFYAQYDIENSLDELGHDGRIGGIVSKKLGDRVAARLAFVHTSNHIGDEYLLRNHSTLRPSSRKEEIATGLSWQPTPRWRTYGEIGYGLNLGMLNRPWKMQTGLEYESVPFGRRARWYAATDMTTWKENAWQPSVNLQTGIVFPFPETGRAYRFGVEVYRGRAQLDSFENHREDYIVVGTWLDL
jgi:hypothetical protein